MSNAIPDDTTDPPANPPLTGLRVIELHAIGPVPFAGMVLRELGASIVRVSPPTDPGLGVSLDPRFDLLNAGKERLALDLKTPAGLAALQARLADADVLLEGFRPGVLERLGLEPAMLRERHPRLVVGRLSGWGEAGELAPRAGHDINYLALAGILHAIGPKAAPVPPLNLVADFGGGAMHLLLGVMACLIRRGTTGRGGIASTSILAGSIGLTPLFYGLAAGGRWTLGRAENLLDGGAPFYRVYETLDRRHVAVGALEPKFFRELLALTQTEEEIDAARQYDRDTWPAMQDLLAQRFAGRTRDAWSVLAAQRDCCVSPVLDFAEASHAEHNRANGWYTDAPYPRPSGVIDFG